MAADDPRTKTLEAFRARGGVTWDGDMRKDIALDDVEGTDLYHKAMAFADYTKLRKLTRHLEGGKYPWSHNARVHNRLCIDRLEERYPDFKETYERNKRHD